MYAKQLTADLLIPDALDGTKSSANWKTQPGGMDKLNTRAVFPSSNEWDIPDLPAVDEQPAALVPYSSRKDIYNAPDNAAVHFFLDDYRFESLWTNPYRGLERIARLGIALTPDFSMWRDMPMVMQLWQVYRSRWCGAWLLANGIDMVPTVSWSTPRTYEFAFAGLPKDSTVAISTVGLRNRDARRLFTSGLEAMVERLNPSRVLIYGQATDAECVLGDIEVRYYPSRWMERGR